MADDRKLEEDQLVSKLIPDPTQGPPNAVSLRGYLGKAPAPSGKGKETLWRLYTSPALDEYAEIPESEILHTQKLPGEQGTIVWVPKTLPLKYVHVHSAQIQAELLGSGSIAQTRLPTVGVSQSVGGGVQQPSIATVCSQITCPPTVRGCIVATDTPSYCFRCEPLSAAVSHCTQCPPLSASPSHCTLCPTPSATPSHCTLCPPPATAISHCTICPPPVTVTPSHCIVCPTPATITPSHCTVCPTPTASPSQFTPCATPTVRPSHLATCPVSHLPQCPVEGPGTVGPEE